MISSDKILDIRDKISSLEYCLDGDVVNANTILKSEDVLTVLDDMSDSLILKTSRLNKGLIDGEVLKSKKVEDLIKSKMTTYMSLAFKIEMLKRRISTQKEIKVSKYVFDFIKNV